jgi:hypothetical protein
MFIEVTNCEATGSVLINVNSITSISEAHDADAKSAIVYPVPSVGAGEDGVVRESGVLHRGLFKESYASLRGALARNGRIINIEEHL